MRIDIKILEGRKHFVVPVIMAVEGVLNGSNGPLFYPAAELEKSIHLWNGKPVVVYHPDMYNSGLAGNPTVFNQQKVGTVFFAKFSDRALKAEAWLDIERLGIVDKRVLNAIHQKKMVEVSTGLFTDTKDEVGTFNGKAYDGVAHNYRPDHLAILPDQVGACSIADGAGLCRNLLTGVVQALDLPSVMS